MGIVTRRARPGSHLSRADPRAHFSFAGWALIASVPFTALAVLAGSPAIFWPAMFGTFFLLLLDTGLWPPTIGRASDAFGLRLPVLITGLMLGVAGVVLLSGRRALARDLAAAAR